MTTSTDIPGTPTNYAWSNSSPQARNQHNALATVLDEHTTAILTPLTVHRPGVAQVRWLDAGAGAGSIALWLAERLGPTGRVHAIDTDPSLIPAYDNLTVQRANLLDVDLRPGSYHGIHARLVLEHDPHREELLAKFVDALTVDGVLVESEWDTTVPPEHLVLDSPDDATTDLVIAFLAALTRIVEARGMDGAWGRRVLSVARDHGLRDVVTYTDSRSWVGGTGICLLHHSNSIAQQQPLLDAGMTIDQLEQLRTALHDPRLVLSGYLMQTTVARRDR